VIKYFISVAGSARRPSRFRLKKLYSVDGGGDVCTRRRRATAVDRARWWTREQAASIERRRGNIAPPAGAPELDPSRISVWDTWLLRDRHGEIADVNGYRLAFSLTAPADLLPGKRHDVAEIRCFYPLTGSDGTTPDRSSTAARSASASGPAPRCTTTARSTSTPPPPARAADEMTYTQRIAVAHGGTASADEDGIELSGPWTHETLLTPDGEWYETEAQSRGMTYTFRDPWFFEDSATGETHLLFEANAPAPERPGDDEATAHRREFNGCVGVAVSESGDPLSWELRPPLLDAVEVNQELERPHVVVADGRYYLFVCSHVHTFAPGVTGPDGRALRASPTTRSTASTAP